MILRPRIGKFAFAGKRAIAFACKLAFSVLSAGRRIRLGDLGGGII